MRNSSDSPSSMLRLSSMLEVVRSPWMTSSSCILARTLPTRSASHPSSLLRSDCREAAMWSRTVDEPTISSMKIQWYV
ncbi:hypothetical protein EYF80_001476 [Liparis tanakae]|uniref:Uncharacterized protein n=1 Tax=Liparis tanakae TaxID=230148 RepID=A0A4Z2JDK9_9TELE|nr:hypothetical protein EYF80_001476 [Liparis tanakae]